MILSGKDIDINELMLQLEIKNVGKMKCGITWQFTDEIDQVNGFNIEIALQWDEISKVDQRIALQ
jgi:hypothetical protein